MREIISVINSVLDYIRYNQLNWYGHVRRVDEERLPLNILGMVSAWKKKK